MTFSTVFLEVSVLRQRFGAQFANCRLSCGWGPKTWGQELPTLWLTKSTRTGGDSQVDGYWETLQEWSTQEEEQDLGNLPTLGLWGLKAMVFLEGISFSSFCVTEPRINVFMENISDSAIGSLTSELWRNLVWLHMRGVCAESGQAPLSSLELLCRRPQQWKPLALGKWLPASFLYGQTGKFP